MFGKDDGALKLDEVTSSFGVDDLAAAFAFYEKLGLKPLMRQAKLFILWRSGSSIWVFERKDYQPSSSPVLIFSARKLDRTIEYLTARGVAVEPFDPFEGLSREERRELDVAPEERIKETFVSFKDPAGNRIAVMQAA